MAFFFGVFGVHRFYVGKFWTGLLLLATGGGFGIWWIVDLVLILLGRFDDAEGRILGPPQATDRGRIDDQSRRELPGTRREQPPHDEAADEGVTMGSLDDDEIFDDEDDDLLEDPLKKEFEELEKEMEDR